MATSSATIQTGEIHVWSLSFSDAVPDLTSLHQLLSDDERTRAARFISDIDRTRFTVARGVLRQLLSAYTGHPARSIELVYGLHGRPAVTASQAHDINFNLSHSGEHALFALTGEGEVGIDIERIRPHSPAYRLRLARRLFSEMEFSAIEGLNASCVEQAFFACWTRKEAYLKAKGTGLTTKLDEFEVTFLPDEPPAMLRTEIDGEDPHDWQVFDVAVPEGYVAALVARC